MIRFDEAPILTAAEPTLKVFRSTAELLVLPPLREEGPRDVDARELAAFQTVGHHPPF